MLLCSFSLNAADATWRLVTEKGRIIDLSKVSCLQASSQESFDIVLIDGTTVGDVATVSFMELETTALASITIGKIGIHEAKQSREDGAYYTLQGQRVENPGKGLYIKNGKKIVIR